VFFVFFFFSRFGIIHSRGKFHFIFQSKGTCGDRVSVFVIIKGKGACGAGENQGIWFYSRQGCLWCQSERRIIFIRGKGA